MSLKYFSLNLTKVSQSKMLRNISKCLLWRVTSWSCRSWLYEVLLYYHKSTFMNLWPWKLPVAFSLGEVVELCYTLFRPKTTIILKLSGSTCISGLSKYPEMSPKNFKWESCRAHEQMAQSKTSLYETLVSFHIQDLAHYAKIQWTDKDLSSF